VLTLRRCGATLGLVWLALAARAADQPRLEVHVGATEATVGDPIELTLDVHLPPDTGLDPPALEGALDPFTVLSGEWSGPRAEGGGTQWSWRGTIAAYETGALQVPAITLSVAGPEGTSSVASAPVDVTIESVLEGTADGDADAELADLKPPAGIAADYRPLVAALGILAALFAVAGIVWWLHRRFAARLAAVPAPPDPFHRLPPHVWIYAELQRLLERRLPEQGQIDLFYEELARILKRYLSGRYRVDLIERTTGELPDLLRQAGAPAAAIRDVDAVLQECDGVKFARVRPDVPACRGEVERVYRVVDTTKPAEAPHAAGAPVAVEAG